MKIFEYMEKYGYEQLVFCHDKTSGLKAIIAIHDTTLGPALGGTRMWNYENEEDAILDVLRLARGMTYKAAAAGLNLGGGKAVIIGDPKKDKSEELWRAFGRFVQSLNAATLPPKTWAPPSRTWTSSAWKPRYVTGVSASAGSSGDPSPRQLWVFSWACWPPAKEVWGSDDISGKDRGCSGHRPCGLLPVQASA